jgi:hypothetical protein
MLLGAFLALVIEVFITPVGSEWPKYAPIVYAIFGALIGLYADVYARTQDERARREMLLAGFICVLLAILWAAIIR